MLKDAQKNAEETGYFCYNTVSEELAVSMNYSAAELGRDESEFELSNLIPIPAKLVDAPAVQDSKIVYECKYLQTINVAMFSIVVGEVVAVSIDRSILSSSGATDAGDAASMFVDPMKLRPIARLGYMDEYGLFY